MLQRTRTHAFACLLAVSGSGVAATAAAAPMARTENGFVTGFAAQGMQQFLGIRYAAPPVGALRWQPPQPVPQAMATTTATAFAPHCAQAASPYGVASNSEDCLYLNVYVPNRPRPTGSTKLPVLFWIHGGALVVGESDGYNPANLVNDGNIIVVTINYRLGYFGFLATTGLDAEGHPAGNYGLQDQQFAMSWVQRNIAGFGGDPSRITMAGESAGGLSTLSNMVSPSAYGLFSRAIVESGGYSLTLPTLATAEASGATIASGLGCAPSDTTCLRAATVSQILAQEASAGLSITTIVDGTTLPESINTAFAAGRFARVPLLNGSNRDEYRQFLSTASGLTAAQYPAVLDSAFGQSFGPDVATEYPVGDYLLPDYGVEAAITDEVFACTARQIDTWTSKYVTTYAYEFSDRNAPEDFLPAVKGYNFGASHASELQYLFNAGTLPPGVRALNASQEQLSRTMVTYWTNFVTAASPNGGGAPVWPNYALNMDDFETLVPPTPAVETTFSAEHHCGFWQPLVNPS